MTAEWDAARYHRVSTPQVAWGQKVLTRLPLRGDETVLDAGCGTGRLTAELLERLPRGSVVAADRSENMLRAARGYLEPCFGARVQYLLADLQDFVLSQPVDAIFSTATLHWVLYHPRLFGALFRALKPGGWLVAQCGGGRNLECLLGRASTLMASERYAPFFAGWQRPWEFADDASTANRLRSAGFVDVETSLETAPTVLASADEYREFVTTVNFRLHLARLPDAASREAFVESLTQQAARDDPPYQLDYRRLNLRGRRPSG